MFAHLPYHPLLPGGALALRPQYHPLQPVGKPGHHRTALHRRCQQDSVHSECLIRSNLYPESRTMVGTDGALNWCCFQVVCSITAGLLHFSLLSVFCWLCLEGVELCLLQREVFEGHNSRRKYFYLCGYSIPGVVVAVSAAIDFRGYGSKTAYALFCFFVFFTTDRQMF